MKKYIGIIPLFLTFLASLVLWIFTHEGMIFFPFWILPLMVIIIWGIFVAIKTISRGEYKKTLPGKIKLGLAVLNTALIISFILIRFPMYKCDAYKMAKKYERIKDELESFTSYLNNQLERNIVLEFNRTGVEMFFVDGEGGYYKKDLNAERIDSLCQLAGLDKKAFNYIRKELKNIGCISIHTCFPEACEYGYKRVLFGMYSFIFLTDDASEKCIKELSDDPLYIPYDDKCLFQYMGGAFDRLLGWREQEKAEALEKFNHNAK